MSFSARNLGFAYGLDDVTFELPRTGFVAVAGPNGAGKSTLVGIMAALRRPYRGSCTYGGVEIRQWRRRELARRIAFLPQSLRLEFPFTAQQVVLMGRTPYGSAWTESSADHAAVERAMQTTDTLAFAARDFRTLSGGEGQRVILAAALAQEPEALLLDEPTSFLDLRHQLAIYRLLADLARKILVVAVTHDLNLALRFADRVLVLDGGRIAGDGTPPDVLTPELIQRVFGVHASAGSRHDGGPHLFYDA
jgi:iron complex transport system ATP-binding protein